jgi:flotillin
MVSSGSSEVGAAKLTGEVLTIVSRIPELVKGFTNIDVTKVNQHHKYI